MSTVSGAVGSTASGSGSRPRELGRLGRMGREFALSLTRARAGQSEIRRRRRSLVRPSLGIRRRMISALPKHWLGGRLISTPVIAFANEAFLCDRSDQPAVAREDEPARDP